MGTAALVSVHLRNTASGGRAALPDAVHPGVAYADAMALAREERRRTIRVGTLVVASALLGLGDLDMTLSFVTSIGMSEANPLARAFMSYGSTWPVVLFKLATMALGLGVLWRLRKHRIAEAAGWMILAVMVALTVHWLAYSSAVAECTEVLSRMSAAEDTRWVVITPN